MDELNSDTLWCQRTFACMRLGGVWGVPRSGLVFTKTSIDPPTLTLTEAFPGYDRDYQEYDFTLIAEKFTAAGITVEKQEVMV